MPDVIRLRNALRSGKRNRTIALFKESGTTAATENGTYRFPMYWPLIKRQPYAVHVLTELGASPDASGPSVQSCLAVAAQMEEDAVPLMEALLDCGADPDGKASQGRTPRAQNSCFVPAPGPPPATRRA